MPALPRNPSSMTKERLVEELRKNRVPLPRGKAKKGVYVELYQRHLLGGQTANQQWTSYRNMSVNTSPKLGFSSDEEEEVAVKIKKPAVPNVNNNRSQRKAAKKSKSSEFEDRLAEVEGLSDADLRKKLQSRGVAAGPIVASTRAVYERKLADLMLQPEPQQEEEEEPYAEDEEEGLQEEAADDGEGESQENEDYSDSDVDENIETLPASRSVSSKTTSTYKSRVTRLMEQESSSQARQRSVTPKRKTETTSSTTSSTTTKVTTAQKKEERGKPLVPVWLQILIFLIVAAFLALIWYNMESGQSENPLVT